MKRTKFYLAAFMAMVLSAMLLTGCSKDDDPAPDNNNPVNNDENNNNQNDNVKADDDFSAVDDISYILNNAVMYSDDEYEQRAANSDLELAEESLSASFIETEGEEVLDASIEEEEVFGAARIDNFDYSYNRIELDNEDNENGYVHYGNFDYTVTKQSSRFKITLKKSGGFKVAGTAYLKLGHLAGDIICKKTYRAGQSSIVLYYTPSFDYGVENIFPMVISKDNDGTRSYMNPITIYTDPMYKGVWKYDMELGDYNGVTVRCNAKNTNCSEYGSNQCVAYVKRYIRTHYGFKSSGGNAVDWWWSSVVKKAFYRNENGGSTAPCVGDIIVFKGGDYGHIGIIMEVAEDYIKIVHQNGGVTVDPIGAKLSLKRRGGTYTVGNMYGGTRVTLGWLHHKTRY